MFSSDTRGVLGTSDAGDSFGEALAGGDVDGNACDDIAIGIPADDFLGVSRLGSTLTMLGGPGGITPVGNRLWSLDAPGVPGRGDGNEAFGSVLAMGDFDGDGFADLAVGVPGDAVGAASQAGAVLVLPGSGSGFDRTAARYLQQDAPGVRDTADRGDNFGSALAVGDFDGDGYDDGDGLH